MLEQMRRQGASAFVYVLFIILIAGMIYSLAPSGNGGEGGGCRPASNTIISVDGTDANQTSFLIAHEANGARGRQKVYVALDHIVRRELLAQAAAEHGIRTSDDLIDQEISRGYFFLGGRREDWRQNFLDPSGEVFKYKQFQAWVEQLRVSTGSYREAQARELQASLMSDLVTGAVRISREEALADYLYEHNTVTYDVVAFDPAKYSRALQLTDADVKRFLESHGADVESRYKADERTYKGVKPQLALREIFIPKALPEAAKPADPKPADKAAKPADDKAKPADDKTKVADKTAKPADKAKPADDKTKVADKTAKPADDKQPAAGDAAVAKPFGLPIDAAKAKLETARAAIAAGKLTFADAEKQLAADSSEDAPTANGDHGWRSAEAPGLGDKEIDDAAKLLKPGEMTPVVATERGVYLVIATERREGDLSYDQVKAEIARTLAKDLWSKEAAKRAALDALASAQGKNLDQLYDREQVRPSGGGGLEDILNNPDIPEETKRQLLQQYMQQMQQKNPKSGSLDERSDLRERDVPVAWYADADGSGSSTAPAAAATGSAGTAASAPAPAAAASGSAGSAAGSPAPAAPPLAPVVVTASNDVLPQLGTIAKPKVNRLGPAPRQAAMQGIGRSKEAIAAVFDELSPGGLAKQVYEGESGAYVVVQLINRSQPKVEEFEKEAATDTARMQTARGKAALHAWLKGRCETLTKAGKIRPAADKVRETDDKGNPAPTVYKPCMYFDALDR